MKQQISLSQDVKHALDRGEPVVALESTIITHGLPSPQNLEVARAAEAAVRAAGATPATIAVIGGKICVGLEAQALERLAEAQGVWKLSRADLAIAVATKMTGSTTVAATMILAKLAGIEVFATGGIGGVHHGAEDTFDISADLDELARTSVTVVCAGAKAVLDLPKTFEALETRGVPVICRGADEIPAFWSRESGLSAPFRLDDPLKIAAAHNARNELEIEGGQLIVNPIPAESEIPAGEIAPVIEAALRSAQAAGIRGKAVTPHLLASVLNATKGKSVDANISLLLNNCSLAAEIAVAMANRKS